MTQYDILNVKLPNSQFHKSKSGIKNGTEVLWEIHQSLLDILMMKIIFCITITQVSKFCKAFPNDFSANIKLSKAQKTASKTAQNRTISKKCT